MKGSLRMFTVKPQARSACHKHASRRRASRGILQPYTRRTGAYTEARSSVSLHGCECSSKSCVHAQSFDMPSISYNA